MSITEISEMSEVLLGKKMTPNSVSKTLSRALEKLVREWSNRYNRTLKESIVDVSEGFGLDLIEFAKSLPRSFMKEVCLEEGIDYESFF